MQDGVPVPEEGDGGERGAEDGVACVLVLDAVDAELVLDGVVHRADVGDGLADQIAEAVSRAQEFGGGTGTGRRRSTATPRRMVARELRMAVTLRTGQSLVEDKGHDHQRQQNADEAVAGGCELRRSGEAREDHQVKGEGGLQPDEVELASSGHPGGEEGNCGDEYDQRSDRVHVGKEEDGRAKGEDEAPD